MDEQVDEGPKECAEHDAALDPLMVAPTAVLEGLPDAVVAAASDGRIVFVNAVAEELFGYPRRELLGQQVQKLWPERVRERYTRNMELYFATEHPMRFTIAAWGLRRDGSEFIGQMSWGVVETNAGSLLLAVGRDISDQRAAEARLRAVAAMGDRDPADLANDAVGQLRNLLPVTAAEVRLADGSALATFGVLPETGMRLTIGAGGELFVAPARELSEEELSFVRAIAHTLASGLARLRDEERMRHEAVHDPLTGLANRTLLRDRLEHALARFERDRGETAVLFVDLDNFKQVNDAHGHAAGDTAL
ncbi:MAG: GGDEF domain-containing protein, partial [Solirubrobacterales bacterium]|nr:GGDEF domain-containing protein [Solirubrobacterales bacterium]